MENRKYKTFRNLDAVKIFLNAQEFSGVKRYGHQNGGVLIQGDREALEREFNFSKNAYQLVYAIRRDIMIVYRINKRPKTNLSKD